VKVAAMGDDEDATVHGAGHSWGGPEPCGADDGIKASGTNGFIHIPFVSIRAVSI
jgi:hypothetical protein